MNLEGKLAIVTGANTGIGRITAVELARGGAEVVLACRNEAKTAPVVEEIRGAGHAASERAHQLLERVGLGDRMHHRPNQLSVGQVQRVAICRALVNDPELILMDEPLGNQDKETGGQVLDMLLELGEEVNGRRPEIVIRYALMRRNIEQLPEAVRYWGRKGIARIAPSHWPISN